MNSTKKEPDLIAISQVVTGIIESVLHITLLEMRSPYPKYYEGRLLFAGILHSRGISEKVIAGLIRKNEDRIKVYIDAYNAKVLSCKKFQEVTNTVNRILTNNTTN